MGANSRDRNFEAAVLGRMREVRQLDRKGLALHLIVTGAAHFNDRSFVTQVLDRIHWERGIASLCYGVSNRATHHADGWASSRRCRVFCVAPGALLQQNEHGVLAFAGPDDFIRLAHAARMIVWRVSPIVKPAVSPCNAGGTVPLSILPPGEHS